MSGGGWSTCVVWGAALWSQLISVTELQHVSPHDGVHRGDAWSVSASCFSAVRATGSCLFTYKRSPSERPTFTDHLLLPAADLDRHLPIKTSIYGYTVLLMLVKWGRIRKRDSRLCICETWNDFRIGNVLFTVSYVLQQSLISPKTNKATPSWKIANAQIKRQLLY